MDITRLADLRPRFVWDIVDDAFDLYRERFALFLGVTAVAYVPALLLDGWISSVTTRSVGTSDVVSATFLSTIFLSWPIQVIASTFQIAAVAVVVDGQIRGTPIPNTGAAYGPVIQRSGALLCVAALIAVLSSLGVITAFILSLYIAIYSAFTALILVLERRPIGNAFKRSFALAGSDRARVFGVLVLIGFLTLILMGGVTAVVGLAFSMTPHGAADAASREQQTSLMMKSANGIITILLKPIGAIALTLLYFDLRVRREGIDLAAQAKERSVELAADPFGDLSSTRVVRDQQRGRKVRTK